MENKNKSANKDKVAIVMGSATGIGYETAIHLAKNGFHTYASMRNLPKADQITKIAKTDNLPLRIIQLDVTDDISINKAIDTVINESGKVDVLVNNAGYGLIGSIEDAPLKERIVREVGYGLSLEGASAADLVKSMQAKG